jgi:hypothetical protein
MAFTATAFLAATGAAFLTGATFLGDAAFTTLAILVSITEVNQKHGGQTNKSVSIQRNAFRFSGLPDKGD